jgi:hypothetical protein
MRGIDAARHGEQIFDHLGRQLGRRIPVRMVALGERKIGLADLILGRAGRHAEHGERIEPVEVPQAGIQIWQLRYAEQLDRRHLCLGDVAALSAIGLEFEERARPVQHVAHGLGCRHQQFAPDRRAIGKHRFDRHCGQIRGIFDLRALEHD